MIANRGQHTCEPYMKVMAITTDQAAAWLEQNEANRSVNWNTVAELARDMRAGRFGCTHQGIAFDVNGRLIDGQHRLWAILEADIAVRMKVFFNESPENLMYSTAAIHVERPIVSHSTALSARFGWMNLPRCGP